MVTKSRLLIASITVLALGACATPQENPNYQYSSKYKNAEATTTYANYSQPSTTYASTRTVSASGSMTNHECLNKETKRELIGGAVGGTVGAIAGKKIIGGTKGTIVGAALGGAAGYGIGDKSIDCDPIPTRQYSEGEFGAASAYQATPAVAGPITCPAGTTAQPNGTCMLSGDPRQAHLGNSTQYGGGSNVASGSGVAIAAPTDQAYAQQDMQGTPGYQAIHGGGAYEIAQSETPSPSDEQVITQTISGPIVMAGASQAVTYDYSQNIISANTPAEAGIASETRIIPATPSLGQNYTVKQGDTVYSLSRNLCVGVSDIQSANGLGADFAIKIGQTISLPQSRC